MTSARHWLSGITWDAITGINQKQCEAKKLTLARNKRHDEARKLWENSAPKSLSLFEAIDVCRQCNDQVPFTYNTGNTFAAVCAGLIADWVKLLPPFEARMLEQAVTHYVNGKIVRAELKTTIDHALKCTKPPAQPAQPTPPPPQVSAPRQSSHATA